jgi:phosphoglycolate phosphatase
MSIKVVVFDFDGTLVESNQIKYDAYYRILPSADEWKQVINRVVARIFEKSRYTIIEEILREKGCGLQSDEALAAEVYRLGQKYGEKVFYEVKRCPARPSAENLLRELHKVCRLYLSSISPEKQLRELVAHRGWTGYFEDVFGFPREKSDTLNMILDKEDIRPADLLVVGDGESDKVSARKMGCRFFEVRPETNILDVLCLIAHEGSYDQ